MPSVDHTNYIPSEGRFARVGVALLLTLALGCSGETEPPPASGNLGRSTPPASPSAARTADPLPAVFEGRLRRLPAWGDDLRRRIDPAADSWPTEVFAIRAEEALREGLTEALAGRASFGEALGRLFDLEGSLSTLYPEELVTAFEDGEYTVLRGTPAADTSYPVGALDELGAAWRAALEGFGEPRVELDIDALRKRSDGGLETQMVLRINAERGARIQQNIRLAATWTRNGASLSSLRRVSFEELRTRHLPFPDLTLAVFGDNACFAEQIRLGNENYHLRQDRTCKQPFLGMHGVAIGDVDGDGLEDIYMGQPGGQPNRLFVHQSDGTAKDVARAAQVDFLDNTGPVLLVDLDGNGAPEAITTVGPNIVLAWNDGDGHFPQKTVLVGTGEPEISTLSAADPDGDGDLDLFAGRYVAGGLNGGVPLPYYEADNGAGNFYWRNDGNRRFTEAAADVGLDVYSTRFTLASVWDDFDDDGDQDLYVVNDFGSNCFFRNDDGHFTEIAESVGVLDTAAGMGAATADVDLDGKLDLYVTNMTSALGSRVTSQPRFQAEHPETKGAYMYHARGNTLLVNNGDGTYRDVSGPAGVSPAGWAWGGNFLDWNNDGYEDIVVPNGFVTNEKDVDLEGFMWRRIAGSSPLDEPAAHYANAWDAIRHFSMFEGYSYNGHERNYAYLNMGGLRFSDVSYAAGLDFLDDGRAAATVDWDDDGRVDLLLRNRTGPRLRLLRNDHGAARSFVSVELRGTESNRDAVGARVVVEAGGRRLRRVVQAGEGFLCASSLRLHFGLNGAERIERMTVIWPSGARETFEDLAADARYRIVEGEGKVELVEPRTHPKLAQLEGEELPVKWQPIDRIVLLDRLPLDPLGLPTLNDGTTPTFADLKGRALILAVGPFERPNARAALEALAPVSDDLAAKGIEIIALSLTEASNFEASRRAVQGLGLRTNVALDETFRTALEVVVVEVLGPYESLPMPLMLAIDAAGELCALYCGRVHPQRVIDDLATVGGTTERLRGTEGLTGGRWAWRPERKFSAMSKVFDHLGQSEAAAFYSALASERGQGK